MLTSRLRKIMMMCMALFVVHAVEEWFSAFYDVDPTFGLAARLAPSESAAVFLGFQLTFLTLLVLFYVLLLSSKWRLRALALFGVVITLDTGHTFLALAKREYYPGSVTAVLFFPLAVLFWIELRRVWRMTEQPMLTTDAVCGMQIHVGELNAHVAYRGRDFWFCSVECKDDFEKDPERYVTP